MRLTRVLPLFVLTALALPATARAQRIWHDEQGRDAVRFDLTMPSMKGGGYSFFTGTFVPGLSLRIGDGVRFEGDLPFVRADYGNKSSLRLGNPYAGLRIGEDDKPVSGILGVRLPISKSPNTTIGGQANAVGAATDYDVFEAYAASVLTFQGGLEYHHVRAGGFMVGARGVGTLEMNTNGDPTADSEMSFDYGLRAGYEGARGLATLAWTGRYLITAPAATFHCIPNDGLFDDNCDPKGFDERTHNQAAAVFELRRGRLRPRVTFRVPFDKDLRNVAGFVFGAGLSIAH